MERIDFPAVDKPQEELDAEPGHLLQRLAHRGELGSDDAAQLQVVETDD
jgi:hypothetical protein